MPQFEQAEKIFASLIFWELVSFGILLWVLSKYALPPILEALETRERKIRENIDQAEQDRTAAEQHLRSYEVKLQGATQEAEAIVAAARDKAQRLLEENERRLRTETERIKTETSEEIERERRKALQDIRGEAADLALLVAEKVLARSLSDDDNRRLAKEALQSVSSDQSSSGHA